MSGHSYWYPVGLGLTAAQWATGMYQVDLFAVIVRPPNSFGLADKLEASTIAQAFRFGHTLVDAGEPPEVTAQTIEEDAMEGQRRCVLWDGGVSD